MVERVRNVVARIRHEQRQATSISEVLVEICYFTFVCSFVSAYSAVVLDAV
jgi:hypothetical protein